MKKNSDTNTPSRKALLVADVGGTNCTLALARADKGRISLLFRAKYASRTIKDFPRLVQQVINSVNRKYSLQISQACFAGAGPISPNGKSIKITHLPWSIEAEKIKKVTGLAEVLLINDFDAIAYGLDAVPAQDIVLIKPGKAVPRAPRALLGPGTGLGKSIIIFDEKKQAYVPISSEGGHASAALETEEEFELAKFIQQREKSSIIAWEDVVSGQGLVNIYQFLEKKYGKGKKEISQSNYDPAIIAQYKDSDPLSQKTFDIFTSFTARCAKNLALDALARGGVYLAGGITAKNLHVFKGKVFKDEFIHSKNMEEVLVQIPVLAITNYEVSLYGAARAVLLKTRGRRL